MARIEWWSGARAAERPLAVVVAGDRREVEVERTWVEGGSVAGEPIRRMFIVLDAAGRRYRLTLHTNGTERVELALPPSRGA